MTLKDFEEYIDAVIHDRGLDYFHEENVDNLEKIAPGIWRAQVYGTETYNVEVRTHRTQIKAWDCTCPYDHGPVCKHVVAVFYAIATALESKKTDPKKIGVKKKSPRKDKVKEILKKTDKKGLETFVISQFSAFGGLKNAFIAHFSELLDEDPETKYRTLVLNIYKAAKGRQGYIDYSGTKKLVNPLYQLIEKAERLLTEKNQREALVITKTLLEEVPVMMLHVDDSDGATGSLMDDAFDILYEIVQKAPPMVKDELFEYCHEEYPKEKYRNFGFESNFLHLMPLLITLKEQEGKFYALLDAQIEKAKRDDYSEYRLIELIKTKIEYLTNAKKNVEADALIEKNKEYPDFRMLLIDKALAQKDFEKAKKLCHEGTAIAKEKRFLGITRKWQDELLRIAETEKNIDDIRRLAEKLYFDIGYGMSYYLKLKKTYTKDEWTTIYEGIIKKIHGSKMRGGYREVTALADIFTEEQQWPRLLQQLQLARGSLSLLDAYAPHIIGEYPIEILDYYEIAVKENAKNTGRSIYNETARYLKKIEKMKGGSERVKKLLLFFRETYKNRPAMMQVLEKKFPNIIQSK